MVRRDRRRKNQNIQIFLFRLCTLFVLNPYAHFNFLRLIVLSFKILTLTLSFVRSIASNLLKLSNIHVSWFDSIRHHYLFYSSQCPFLMTINLFHRKLVFGRGSKFHNVELIPSKLSAFKNNTWLYYDNIESAIRI
jgi:hypothetical protein